VRVYIHRHNGHLAHCRVLPAIPLSLSLSLRSESVGGFAALVQYVESEQGARAAVDEALAAAASRKEEAAVETTVVLELVAALAGAGHACLQLRQGEGARANYAAALDLVGPLAGPLAPLSGQPPPPPRDATVASLLGRRADLTLGLTDALEMDGMVPQAWECAQRALADARALGLPQHHPLVQATLQRLGRLQAVRPPTADKETQRERECVCVCERERERGGVYCMCSSTQLCV
jgi:hypothetical protein